MYLCEFASIGSSDQLSVCAANEFERTGTHGYPGARMRRLSRSLRSLKFPGARYYWYAGEQSALQKHAEDRKYLTDTDRIRTLLKDVSTKLQEQSEFSSNSSHVGSWATYFNDRLKLRDGLGALDPNTALFRHLTRLFTYPVTLAHVVLQLQLSGHLRGGNDDSRLKIVCVGSRAEGRIPYLMWEECSKMVGRKMHIHFIGPNQVTHQNDELEYKDTLKLTFETGLYQPPLPTAKESAAGGQMMPDLFVAFNSGNSDEKWQHIWRPTLVKAAELEIPLVFTSFDAVDLASDFAFTMRYWDQNDLERQSQLKNILRPTPNPFLDMMPLIYESGPKRIIHTNQYIYGVIKDT